MKKQLLQVSSLVLSVSLLSGCSLFSWLWGKDGLFYDRAADYREARMVPEMRVPQGLATRPLEPLLPVPARVNTPLNEDRYEVPKPRKLEVVAKGSDFSVQTGGDGRTYLLALRTPAQLWSSIRQLLSEYGLDIVEQRPQAGELVTGWQPASDYIPALRSAVSGPVESRIRLRIEPGVQRNTSEIAIQSAERSAGENPAVAWGSHSANARLDTAVLDELQSGLTRTLDSGETVSLATQREFDAPERVELVQDANGNPLLRLDTDFNRGWSRVGRALEAADIRVEDLNRSLGIYYVNLAEGADGGSASPGFWSRLFGGGKKDDESRSKRAERYQVRLSEAGRGIQVAIEKDLNTLAPPDIARKVLVSLQNNLMNTHRRPGGAGPADKPPRDR